MTRRTRHRDRRRRTLRNTVDTSIHLLHQPQHLPRNELVALLITREIDLRQLSTLRADMTKRALDTECRADVPHRSPHLRNRRVLREEAHVDERIRWPFAWCLCAEIAKRKSNRQ